MSKGPSTMSVNSTNADSTSVRTEHQVGTPATTYLISQGGSYYPLYQMDGCQAQAQAKPCCRGAFQPAEQTAKYDDYDLYSMKPNVKVDFAETFQESEGSETIAVVWKYNKAIYSYTMRGFYTFLVALLGPFLAIAWGLIFATMNFLMVWGVNPTLKLVLQLTRIVEILGRGIIRATLDPLFQSFGQVFTFLRGQFTLNVPGLESLTKKKENVSTIKLPQFHESQA